MKTVNVNDPARVDKSVLSLLNDEYAEDLSSPVTCRILQEKLREDRERIKTQLSEQSDWSKGVGRLLETTDDAVKSSAELAFECDAAQADVRERLRDLNVALTEIRDDLNRISEMEASLKYLELLKFVDETSGDIQSSLAANMDERAVESYTRLTDIYQSVLDTKCENFIKFLSDSVVFWHNSMNARLYRQFESLMKLINWPRLQDYEGADPREIHFPTREQELKFERFIHLFISLELPDSLQPDTNRCDPISLPVQVLLSPLKKRFQFHFSGKRQTNKLDKPEWFLSQILVWIKHHEVFHDEILQPILDKFTVDRPIRAQHEFAQGLIGLASDKLRSTMPQLIGLPDDRLLSHTIDEVLLFAKEVRSSFRYLRYHPACLDILIEDECFAKWIQMERQFASEKMDRILTSSAAWLPRFRNCSDTDQLKVPECGEKMMTLIQTMTDRYKLLPNAEHKILFMNLQLELMDDFRIRLFQLLRETEVKLGPGMEFAVKDHNQSTITSILNAVGYIIHVLGQFSDLPIFVELQYQKQKPRKVHSDFSGVESSGSRETGAVDDSIFDEIIKLFKVLQDEMTHKLADYILYEVKAKSYPYKNSKWFCMPPLKSYSQPSLSQSACPMFSVISVSLSRLRNALSVPLFTEVWQQLACRLDEFLYDEVVLPNKFNEGGANQLQFDITRNLFPLFGEYTNMAEMHFQQIKESCILLNLAKGNVILLLETIQGIGEPGKDSNRSCLKDVGVYGLSLVEAKQILALRTDINILN